MIRRLILGLSSLLLLVLLLQVYVFARAQHVLHSEKIDNLEHGIKVISMSDFVSLAIANDTEFERILIEELFLQYERDLRLPVRDLILEIKTQHDFMLKQSREELGGTLSLRKLFPLSATTLSAEYKTTPLSTARENTTEFTVEISQPIAKNAFGKSTRLKDKIIGLEIDVVRHQIIEAYEDYLAATILRYYDWYAAYQNLKIGESSYQENRKLLENILEREKNNIALAIDVNKVRLQVLAKKEQLIELRQAYYLALHFIQTAIRYDGEEILQPQAPDLYHDIDIHFDKDYAFFRHQSRTYAMLDLLKEKSQIEVDREADALLPSINLFFGYQARGSDVRIKEKDDKVYAGISLGWPFGQQVDRALHQTAKIALERTMLSNIGTHFRLYTQIKNLSYQISTEQQLLNIAREKIILAESVLEDETRNYSFGRVTLNDYISAVNILDANRFNKIFHEIRHRKLLIEWLRITDQLVQKNEFLPI